MHKKILIIGAGLAGLSAAYHISRKCPEVIILEASDRIGGRVFTQKINRQNVDFGGFIIYPWYKTFHKLSKELDLKSQLKRIPHRRIYYFTEKGKPVKSSDIYFHPIRSAKLWFRSIKALLFDKDVANPDLDIFSEKSVEQYLKENLPDDEFRKQQRIFDTISQGFCYAPIDEFRLALCAPMFRQNMLWGDIKNSSYLDGGTDLLAKKMAEKIQHRGGEIKLKTRVEKIKDTKIYTSNGNFTADHIIISSAADKSLFSMLPVTHTWRYTNFITAVVRCSRIPEVSGDSKWGSAFFYPEDKEKLDILSVINIGELYSKEIKDYLTLNIKVNSDENISKQALLKFIKSSLPKKLKNCIPEEIIHMAHWQNAMPVVPEDLIRTIRDNQGTNNYYFCGDYLGSPSMETALKTGCNTAKIVLKNL